MPTIFRLEHEGERDLYFLVQPKMTIEVVQMLKANLSNYILLHEDWTLDEIVEVAEDTIEEYGGHIVPFTLFSIKY